MSRLNPNRIDQHRANAGMVAAAGAGGRANAGMVLPGVQLSDRMNNQQRKRGRQNVNRNGLGMDDTGDMSKIFGGGGNSNNNNPRRQQSQPQPPQQRVAEVNDRLLQDAANEARYGNQPRNFAQPKVANLPNIGRRNQSSPTPQAPSTDMQYGQQQPAVDLTKMDRAMDILVNQLDRGNDDSARVRSLEQRLGFLESENSDLKQFMTSQVSSLMAKLAQSEDRLLSEVQQRVELELEVRSRTQTSGVVEAHSNKRLATVERLVESQQNDIAILTSQLKSASDRLTAIPAMQDRVNAAISTVHQGSTEVRGVDDDVARLKEALRKRDSEQRDLIDTDNRKSAVLFGEVARLGKSIESAGSKTERALAVMSTRFESLEGRLKADERGIIAMEGRDAERFDGLTKRAEQLEKYLVELSDMSLRQRQQLDTESGRRKATQDEQQKLVSEVRSALQKTDTDVSSRLTALLTQIGEQLVAEREIHERKLEEQRTGVSRQERAMEERNAMERDRMSKRFQALEAALREEAEIRAKQTQQIARETDERAQELRSMVARESTARTGIQEVMEATQQRVTERTAENVNVLEKEMERRLVTLEEVIRTEIKARMRGMEKIYTGMETLKGQQASSVNRARSEAAKMLDSSNHETETRLRTLENGLDKSQRESLMALSRSSQAQSLLNADLGGRLDNLEQRELQDENETEQVKIDLEKKITTFGRANQDAIGALSSVVADHRRESEEMVAKQQSEVEKELEGSAETMRQAITNFSSDVMAEIEKLRETSAASITKLKDEMTEMFESSATNIVAVNTRITQVETNEEKRAVEEEAELTRRLKEEKLSASMQREETNLARCTSVLDRLITTLEEIETKEVLQSMQSTIETTKKELNEQVNQVRNVSNQAVVSLTATVNEKTNQAMEDVNVLRVETNHRLNNNLAGGVTDSLKNAVVEENMYDKISLLEKQMNVRLNEMEMNEAEKVKRVNDTLSVIDKQVQQAKEDRNRLEARVESVVGQVEEERNNAETEWQASIDEANRKDDIEQDGPAITNGSSGNDIVTETGVLPTADVGFPDPSEDGI